MSVDGLGIAYAAAGGVLIAAGYRGARVSDAFRAVLDGQAIPSGQLAITAAVAAPAGFTAAVDQGATGLVAAGDAVGDASTYVGDRYVWGGAPGTTPGVNNGTDCSGFMNMVFGRDLGRAIPGYPAGGYDGSTHGPATIQWNAWHGVAHLGKYGQAAARPGDLLMWATHIGFYLGNGQMLSSLSARYGVTVSPAATSGPAGEGSPTVGRYTGAA